MNVGVPVCVSPWIPVEVAGSAVGVTGVTSGVYVVVAVDLTASPFLLTPTGAVKDTPIPLAFPLNCGSGWNVTSPVSGLIV